jgi:hypothetical protein
MHSVEVEAARQRRKDNVGCEGRANVAPEASRGVRRVPPVRYGNEALPDVATTSVDGRRIHPQ